MIATILFLCAVVIIAVVWTAFLLHLEGKTRPISLSLSSLVWTGLYSIWLSITNNLTKQYWLNQRCTFGGGAILVPNQWKQGRSSGNLFFFCAIFTRVPKQNKKSPLTVGSDTVNVRFMQNLLTFTILMLIFLNIRDICQEMSTTIFNYWKCYTFNYSTILKQLVCMRSWLAMFPTSTYLYANFGISQKEKEKTAGWKHQDLHKF